MVAPNMGLNVELTNMKVQLEARVSEVAFVELQRCLLRQTDQYIDATRMSITCVKELATSWTKVSVSIESSDPVRCMGIAQDVILKLKLTDSKSKGTPQLKLQM